ncbi:hypothetical protein DMC47_33215 [Nostoc sp. 3335mG]|nr:hypothetical protein DMC47_33215 [Nostoc sp. 3335mG]
MRLLAARMLMRLAACCLGRHRREWAWAMDAEFEAAIEDGRPLAFALGCFAGACREIPVQREGRFAMASHAVAIGLLTPMAALLMSGPLFGLSMLHPGHAAIHAMLGSEGGEMVLNVSTRGAAPALMLMILSLTAGHLSIAWAMLDREWSRVAFLARFNAAATLTLVIVGSVLLLDDDWIVPPIAGLIVQLAAVSFLMRWNSQIRSDFALAT